MAAKRCPFCGNSAHAKTVGDAYWLDCANCSVQIEISIKAYNSHCVDLGAVLDYVHAQMERTARPRLDLVHMRR
jgi:transcription elongation factor Elf1